MPNPRALLAAACLGLAACGEASNTSEAPVAQAGQHAGTLSYLLERYDSNQDGRLVPGEHGRGPSAFARLDRDGNGFIDASDFEAAPPRGQRKRREQTMLLISQYFQDGSDPTRLSMEELESMFGAYDIDSDGQIDPDEFESERSTWAQQHAGLTTLQARSLLADLAPWKGLLSGMDQDRDDLLSLDEFRAFFDLRSRGATWRFANEEQVQAELASQRPLEGRVAPDFSLQPPDGSASVSLSSFRGKRPVALIFGSYT